MMVVVVVGEGKVPGGGVRGDTAGWDAAESRGDILDRGTDEFSGGAATDVSQSVGEAIWLRRRTICSPLSPRRQECAPPPPIPFSANTPLLKPDQKCLATLTVSFAEEAMRSLTQWESLMYAFPPRRSCSRAPIIYQAALARRFAYDIFRHFSLRTMPTTFFSVTQRLRLISQRPSSATAAADAKSPDTLLRPDVPSTRTSDENWSFLLLFLGKQHNY